MNTFLETPSPTSGARASLEEVQSLLYREADCADEHRFDDWLALWDEEGEILYWIPAGGDDIDPARSISIVYDNRTRLDDRLFRLKSKSAHAQRPRSRMRRVVSNVAIESDDGECVRVRANFILAELRNGHQDVFNGRFIYELRRRDSTLRIASKKVLLINNDDFIDNLSFLL
jgi:3-phenylpropionate/cinnamic acid dioxygenase small subunit